MSNEATVGAGLSEDDGEIVGTTEVGRDVGIPYGRLLDSSVLGLFEGVIEGLLVRTLNDCSLLPTGTPDGAVGTVVGLADEEYVGARVGEGFADGAPVGIRLGPAVGEADGC